MFGNKIEFEILAFYLIHSIAKFITFDFCFSGQDATKNEMN